MIEALKLPKEGGKGLAIIQNEQVRRKLKPSLGNYSEESVSTGIFIVKNWQPRSCLLRQTQAIKGLRRLASRSNTLSRVPWFTFQNLRF